MHPHDHAHTNDQGLAHDLRTLLKRRRALRWPTRAARGCSTGVATFPVGIPA
jgi:hypothetical protein